jgi:intracellular septation protein A
VSLVNTPAPLAPLPPAADAEIPARPRLRAVIRRVALSLLVACVIPATLFYTTFALAGVWTAIIVALCWSYGAITWRAVTGRRTSGLLIIAATLITIRTVVSLAAGSTFLYFLQPIISDAVVGTTFLLSLASARPMVARLAGDFYPMTEELKLRPRVRRLFRNLTIMWAALCIGKALFTLWLLESQSLENFVLIKSVTVLAVNMFAAAATIGIATLVARQEGLLGPRAEVAYA